MSLDSLGRNLPEFMEPWLKKLGGRVRVSFPYWMETHEYSHRISNRFRDGAGVDIFFRPFDLLASLGSLPDNVFRTIRSYSIHIRISEICWHQLVRNALTNSLHRSALQRRAREVSKGILTY